MPPEVNWAKIRKEYESTDMLLKDLAAKHGLKEGTVRSRKNREGWNRVATQEEDATQRETDVATQEEPREPEPPSFPGQCEAVGHKSGARCKKKAVPGERYCTVHLDGHRESQCTARSKQTGERCRRKAVPGKKVCKFHGGKSTGPVGHQNHMKHGLFAKFIPEDDVESRAFMEEIDTMSSLDIMWQSIKLLTTVIARSPKLAWVKDKDDLTEYLKREKETSGLNSDGWEKEYEIQFPWDKHNSYMATLAKAQKTLESKIMSYEELVEKYEKRGYVVEEHRLRVEKLKADMDIARERLNIDKEKANLGGQDDGLEIVVDYGDANEG